MRQVAHYKPIISRNQVGMSTFRLSFKRMPRYKSEQLPEQEPHKNI